MDCTKLKVWCMTMGVSYPLLKKNELPRTTSQVLIYFLPFQEFCLSGKDKLQQTKQRKVQHIERFIILTISKTLRNWEKPPKSCSAANTISLYVILKSSPSTKFLSHDLTKGNMLPTIEFCTFTIIIYMLRPVCRHLILIFFASQRSRPLSAWTKENMRHRLL